MAASIKIVLFAVLVSLLGLAAGASPAAPSPLVSVIIPTHERPAFLLHALELISRQDYPNIEVIIVDDSEKPQTGLNNGNVKYIHLTERVSIGQKRNIAVSNANGAVIVHWDDDDYFRDYRISAQVAPILSGAVDMTVLEHHFYLHVPSQTFYTVKRASSWGPHFATFVYRKAIFDSGVRYPDNSMAEDYAFAEIALNRGYTIEVMNNEDGKHVYVRHQNTWEFDFEDYDAQVTEVARPEFFSQKDFDFYITVEIRTVAKPPKHYASHLIQWDRSELHPRGMTDKSGNLLAYPKYPNYKKKSDDGLSKEAKIGIGVGVAGGVVLIVVIGIAAYFFFQWQKNRSAGYTRINEPV